MAGSVGDIAARLANFLPSRWFPRDAGTRIGAMLNGFASVLAVNFEQLSYAAQQSVIGTATDAFLDIKAADWLGNFPRRMGELDADYAARIQAEIIRPRNTRLAIYLVLLDLTGNLPWVFRPSYVFDTGGVGISTAWGVAGAWGSYQAPFQALVQIQRGTAQGSATQAIYGGGIGGWGAPVSGYGVGDCEWNNGNIPARGAVTDDEIYAAVASVTPAGHINWVSISD